MNGQTEEIPNKVAGLPYRGTLKCQTCGKLWEVSFRDAAIAEGFTIQTCPRCPERVRFPKAKA